jgi:hypothetical protein
VNRQSSEVQNAGDNVLTKVSWLIPAAILFGSDAAYAQQGCENLVNLTLPYTLITSATSVPEGCRTGARRSGCAASGSRHRTSPLRRSRCHSSEPRF